MIGGRYAIPAGMPLTVLIPSLHRDRGVWGENAEDWDPDHLAPERVAALPPNAYKPFGTGQRACIGRQFALQEATLVLGMLLQRFEFVDYLPYQLRTRTTLTIKPVDFRIQVRPRAGVRIERAAAPAAEAAPQESSVLASAAGLTAEARHGTPLSVFSGRTWARRRGSRRGLRARAPSAATR